MNSGFFFCNYYLWFRTSWRSDTRQTDHGSQNLFVRPGRFAGFVLIRFQFSFIYPSGLPFQFSFNLISKNSFQVSRLFEFFFVVKFWKIRFKCSIFINFQYKQIINSNIIYFKEFINLIEFISRLRSLPIHRGFRFLQQRISESSGRWLVFLF